MLGNEEIKEIWNNTLDMNWLFDDRFDRCFLNPEEVSRIVGNISVLRKHNLITIEERLIVMEIANLGKRRFFEFKEKLRNEPRRIAQKFIGKKNVRKFIFDRDNNICLCCGNNYSLSIDHIIPVNKKGANNLSNLQTLCISCNSKKSDKIIDYREGGRNV
jgi:hypothetical protein